LKRIKAIKTGTNINNLKFTDPLTMAQCLQYEIQTAFYVLSYKWHIIQTGKISNAYTR
jgi:hypothetical protein